MEGLHRGSARQVVTLSLHLALSSNRVRAADLRKLWILVVEQRQVCPLALWSLPQCRLRAGTRAQRSQQ